LITRIIFWEITDHKAPRFVVFSTLLSPRPSYAQIFSTFSVSINNRLVSIYNEPRLDRYQDPPVRNSALYPAVSSSILGLNTGYPEVLCRPPETMVGQSCTIFPPNFIGNIK
jgi:hypothetical protein